MIPALRCAVLLAVLSSARSSDLYLQPPDGSELTRSFELSLEGGVDDLIVSVMGQEQDFREILEIEGLDMDDPRAAVELAWDVTDTVESAVRGRILRLERTFGSLLVDGEEPEGVGDDDFPDAVRFVWNEDDQEYAVGLLDDDASDEDRERARALRLDVDQAYLLPSESVEAGASWTVTLEDDRLLELLLPGFAIEALLIQTAAEDEDFDAEQVVGLLRELFDGAELTLTYTGDERVDDVPCAVLDLDLSGSGSVDLGDWVADLMAESDPEAGDLDLELLLDLDLEGDGRLLWHTEEHRLHRLELEAEVDVSITGGVEIQAEGFTLPIEFDGELSGGFQALHNVD